MPVGRGAGVDSGGVVAGHPYGLGLALGLQLALKSMFAYGLCSPGAFVGRTSWPSARFRTSSTSGGPWGAPKGHPTTDIPFPLPIPLRIYHGISLVAHRPNEQSFRELISCNSPCEGSRSAPRKEQTGEGHGVYTSGGILCRASQSKLYQILQLLESSAGFH